MGTCAAPYFAAARAPYVERFSERICGQRSFARRPEVRAAQGYFSRLYSTLPKKPGPMRVSVCLT